MVGIQDMTLEGLGEMFEGYFAEMCAKKISSHVDGGRREGSRVRRPRSEDPIGVSGILLCFVIFPDKYSSFDRRHFYFKHIEQMKCRM